MALFRYGRNDYKKQQKRLILAAAGSVGIILLLLFFGLPILENFSILVETLKGKAPASQQKSIVLPPVLDPLPVATNSAALTITGQGTPNAILKLYVNDKEEEQLTLPDDGKFTVTFLGQTGLNSANATILGEDNTESEKSNTVTTSVINASPTLDISSPKDGASYAFENDTVSVEGKTDPGNTVMVNDRIVIVQADGSFRSTLKLSEGDNSIKINTKDIAGNTTTVERHVTYEK